MPNPTKQWTVLVYLAGDNNLDSAGVDDLGEMKQVGSTAQLNLLAQFDRAGANLDTTRYYLRSGTTLAADAVDTLGETNMGDPAVLRSFLEWGITEYPAAHYLVVVWNHGNGWDDENIYRAARGLGLQVVRRGVVQREAAGPARARVAPQYLRSVSARFRRSLFSITIASAAKLRGIGYDDNARDFLDNQELKAALAAIKTRLGRKIDLFGMDACLMNMAEVAYQIRGSTTYVVGSEETEPGDGWPYHTILASLAANPAMTPRALGATIVRKYLAAYGPTSNVTQSALAQDKVVALRTAINALGTVLTAGLAVPATYQAIHRTRQQAQAYTKPEYVDLIDYCRKLAAARLSTARIRLVCQAVIAAAQAFVVANGSKGAAVKHSAGVSIYFPEGRVSPLYAKLDFARKSPWAKFLAAY